MLFLASIRYTLLLSVLVLPCIVVQCHQDAELDNNIPYLDDVIAYIMDPRSVEYNEMEDENDESEFDFVGHNPSSSNKADEAVPNDKLAESAVKRDMLEDIEDGEGKDSSKKDKVELNTNNDDELFAGLSLANINHDLMTVRDKIYRHFTEDKEPSQIHESKTSSFLTTSDKSNPDPYDNTNNNKEQNLQVTKNLIGLLYDFRGKHGGKKQRTSEDDDLMDFEGSKKDDIKPLKKSEKEKIDVTVNVNINGVPKGGKKKSKVGKKHEGAKNKTLKVVEEPADKRSIVHPNKNVKEIQKVAKITETDDDDDEVDDDEDDKTSDRRNEGTEAKSLKVSSTLSHLKDVKAPPALMNQLKKKIQQQESEENEDDDDDDESEDDEEEMSGSGSSSLLANKKSKDVPQVALRSERLGENAEKFGNNVHPNLKNSSLSAATIDSTEEKADEGVKKSSKDMTLEEIGHKFKKWQNEKKKSTTTDTEDEPSTTRTWNEEKQRLVKKLKNPLVEAKKKGVVSDDGKDDDDDDSENETNQFTTSANDAMAKVVDTVTTPVFVQNLKKTQEKDVKEVSASADKAFSSVVDNVMSGKMEYASSLSHHALTKSANDLISNVKDVSHSTNMKKLQKFKSQILSEIKKINMLQKQYGPKAKGAGDLTEARNVLEKDLKVVSELEGRLKNHKQAESAHHDQKAFGDFTNSNSETIPEEKLGFSVEDKPRQPKKANKKASKDALKEIQNLLKAEIKRLKHKKTGKPDPKLNDIRKNVQTKLKGFLKNGNLDKNAFKKLAPEIKELGRLLKHRIKNAKSYHKKVEKATKGNLDATHGFAPEPVEHKGIENQLKAAQNALNSGSGGLLEQSQTLKAAKNALSKIQASNLRLKGDQSTKMKTLLTSLNSKLGQVFRHGGFMPAGGQSQQPQQIAGMNPLGQSIQVPSSFIKAFKPSKPGETLLLPKSPYQARALAKAETPEPEFEPDQTKPMADNEPVNTLIEALERDITEVWSYKDQFKDADSLGLDNEKVHNAYANLGSLSGLSLRRSLDRALRGEDVGLAIVGGSISKGGPFSEKGLDYVLKSYFYAIEDYWNKIIRPVTGSSLIVRDCSIGGIATDYYSYCLRTHLPDDKLTNIVLWELSANDMKRYEEAGKGRTQPLEQFVRNVITYRAKPSLIFVNFFANFAWNPDLATHCRNFEDEGGDDIAKYYKITSLSWRNMVCPELQAGSPLFTRDRLFSEDKFHPSIQGHAQVAYLLIDYIRTEFLKNLVKMRTSNIADAVTRLQIPRSIYVPRPLFPDTFTWKPLCYTYMLTDIRQPNNTLDLDTSASGTFKSVIVRSFKIRSDKIAGMNTIDADQRVSYTIHLPPHPGGSIKPYKRLGVMSFTDDRGARIQFDAEPTQTVQTGKRFLEGTTIKYIAKDVRPGDHQLSIRSGNKGFLVCAIVVG